MGTQHVATAILTVLCLTGFCPPLSAQLSDRPASVIVVVLPQENADAALQPVLQDSVLVDLTRSRMKPVAMQHLEEARTAATRDRADYLVSVTWRNTASDFELAIEVWLPDATAPVATGTARGQIALMMDEVVSTGLQQVLPSMQARFPADGTEATQLASAGGSGGEALGGLTTGGGTTGGTTGGGTVTTGQRWRLVELSLGGAPLVTTGAVSDYTKVGALASFGFDLRFRAGKGAFAAGLIAGGSWFRASGTDVADVLVMPIDASVRWTPMVDANPEVSVHAGGGPAMLVAVTSFAGTLTKIVPHVEAGLDVDIGLTPVLGLRLEADYAFAFEGSIVLQGFAPRLSVRMRF